MWLPLLLMCATAAHAEKPAIEIAFVLRSATLSTMLKNGGDHRGEVTTAVLSKLQKTAGDYFPFVDWLPTIPSGQKPVAKLRVEVIETKLHEGAPSDYRLKYFNVVTDEEISIGMKEPFIPHTDLHQPTNSGDLIKRINDQIDVDLDGAAKKDMVDLFLCKVTLVKLPPPPTDIKVVGPAALQLPLAWQALLADKDASALTVEFWVRTPNSHDQSEGNLILNKPQPCRCDAGVVMANVTSFMLGGLPLQPAEWHKNATEVLTRDRLTDFKIFVNQYKKFKESDEASK